MCIALYTQCFPSVCGKNFKRDSGRIQTHDLLPTSADILTSRPPSLPDDDRPARILCSSGFRDIYRLMKSLRRVINNWLNVCPALVCRRSWVQVESPVVFTDTRKALSIQCYTHVGGGQKLIVFITRRKNFINLLKKNRKKNQLYFDWMLTKTIWD